MAEETTNEQTTTEQAEGISEDDLRKLIGEEIDKRVSSLSESLTGIADGIVDKLQGSATDEETLLGKIGDMIDNKLKGMGTGSKNGETAKTPREPKLKIF